MHSVLLAIDTRQDVVFALQSCWSVVVERTGKLAQASDEIAGKRTARPLANAE